MAFFFFKGSMKTHTKNGVCCQPIKQHSGTNRWESFVAELTLYTLKGS
ncbi:MAG: hypothetical protein Q4B04_02440 [bacterium]|nr:hypothetical protein [bacterium]